MKSSLSLFFLKKLILSQRSGSLMRRISFLSFFAVTLSVSVFLIVLFVMNGMNKSITNRIIALDPNITAHFNSKFNDKKEFEIKSDSNYTALRFDSYDLIIRTIDGQFRGANALGYNQQDFQFWINKLNKIKEKNLYFKSESDLGTDLQENEIAIGVDIARSLGLLEGDQVTLIPVETLLLSQFESPVFQKVIIKKIISSDLQDIDNNIIFFNRDNSLQIFKKSMSKNSGYQFWLNDMNNLDQVIDNLKKMSFKSVESWKEKNSSLFFALFMEKTMIGIFLSLAGIIASTSVLTVLALIMSQKKSDIAIIKTLGLSQNKTLILFTKMGLWISLSAVLVGTILGLAVSYYLEKFPLQVLPQIYYDASIPAYVEFKFAGIVFLIAGVLAFLGSYFPAKTTLSIQPAILLKQKN